VATLSGGELDRAGRDCLLAIAIDDSDAGITIVRLVGMLSIASVPRVRDTLLKCLADQPSTVVVDLELVVIQHVVALNVFAVAARHAAVWSGTQLILVSGPLDGRLKPRMRALGRFVRIYPTMTIALASTRRPPIRRLSVHVLAGAPAAAGAARRQVSQICDAWRCPALGEDAVAIADELVSHAVRGSRGDLILRLELRHGMLTVSVTSNQAGHVGSRASFDPLSRCIVSRIATSWGSTPAMSGGTADWAVLQDPAGSRDADD
jgi:anti-anti-sigma regulatory factor